MILLMNNSDSQALLGSVGCVTLNYSSVLFDLQSVESSQPMDDSTLSSGSLDSHVLSPDHNVGPDSTQHYTSFQETEKYQCSNYRPINYLRQRRR